MCLWFLNTFQYTHTSTHIRAGGSFDGSMRKGSFHEFDKDYQVTKGEYKDSNSPDANTVMKMLSTTLDRRLDLAALRELLSRPALREVRECVPHIEHMCVYFTKREIWSKLHATYTHTHIFPCLYLFPLPSFPTPLIFLL